MPHGCGSRSWRGPKRMRARDVLRERGWGEQQRGGEQLAVAGPSLHGPDRIAAPPRAKIPRVGCTPVPALAARKLLVSGNLRLCRALNGFPGPVPL